MHLEVCMNVLILDSIVGINGKHDAARRERVSVCPPHDHEQFRNANGVRCTVVARTVRNGTKNGTSKLRNSNRRPKEYSVTLGKFAFGDRTIPIHARTRGFDVSPQESGVGRRGRPRRGGWSHSPPVGEGGDVDDKVLCVGGGYGGRFCFKYSVTLTSHMQVGSSGSCGGMYVDACNESNHN
mgnify:CR=1 FL=1